MRLQKELYARPSTHHNSESKQDEMREKYRLLERQLKKYEVKVDDYSRTIDDLRSQLEEATSNYQVESFRLTQK